MKEKNEMSKKRLIAYYAVLAGCLALITAITITIVVSFSSRSSGVLDGGSTVTPPDSDSGDGTDTPVTPPDDSANASTKYEFIAPVQTVNMTVGYTFYHNQTLNSYYLHEGVDFSAEAGTGVMAALDGKIKSIVTGDELYGTVITIEHANDIVTTYTYVDAREGLKVGDEVKRGEVIASVAKANGSEYRDGDHLHFEVFEKGKSLDPETKLDILEK